MPSLVNFVHTSDLYGSLIKLPDDGKFIVISGNFLPMSPGHRPGIVRSKLVESKFQKEWLESNLSKIKDWTSGREVLYCSGECDFLEPEKVSGILNDYGVKCVNITNTSYIIEEVCFHGFPYVPKLRGQFNYEVDEIGIQCLLDKINHDMDVLVCRCPPHGVFESTLYEEGIGSHGILLWLTYSKFIPKYSILCGYDEESSSENCKSFYGINVFNAYGRANLVSIIKD